MEMTIYKGSFLSFSFLILSLFSPIYCAADSISLNKRGCFFIDQAKANDIMISFDYNEGYYRAIHASYGYWVNDAVKMRYLGDSSKDFFMRCYIGPNYQTSLSGGLLNYMIPCTVNDVSVFKEGTFCVEIVKKLIGDITSGDYCTNYYTFKAIKSTNIPGLTVKGFSSDQSGCVQPGETITLLATVKNKMSTFQDYGNIGIGLSNTEVITDDISLQCKIEGQKSVGSTDKIICKIPDYISQGYYSILYSFSLLEGYECPVNSINEFNSLNFNGQIKKLQIFTGNFENIKSTLTNISFENPSSIPGLFNLTFSLNNIQNINYITFDNLVNKDIEIKLCDEFGLLIDTKCDFVKSSNLLSIFYLSCTPQSFQKNTLYSLVILSDKTIGFDTSEVLCTNGESTLYKKVIIPTAEYDFFIIYDYSNKPNLDCNLNDYGFYQNDITKIKNYCGSCGLNCITCSNANVCSKCMEGFSLKNSKECVIIKDKINFDKFDKVEDFIKEEKSCVNEKNKMQLFSFKFTYVITQGENLAIELVEYKNLIFANNDDVRYPLNCIIDINPDYIPSNEPNFGYCKQQICTLYAFVNCSFQEKVPNGMYEIQSNHNNDLGNLISKAIDEFAPIQIKYIYNSINAVNFDNSVKVTYKGYLDNSEIVFVCPNITSLYRDCYKLLECEKLSHNENNEENIFKCSKEIYYKEEGCLNFESFMMFDDCRNMINDSFEFQYCYEGYYYNSSSCDYLGSLYMLLLVLFFIV